MEWLGNRYGPFIRRRQSECCSLNSAKKTKKQQLNTDLGVNRKKKRRFTYWSCQLQYVCWPLKSEHWPIRATSDSHCQLQLCQSYGMLQRQETFVLTRAQGSLLSFAPFAWVLYRPCSCLHDANGRDHPCMVFCWGSMYSCFASRSGCVSVGARRYSSFRRPPLCSCVPFGVWEARFN